MQTAYADGTIWFKNPGYFSKQDVECLVADFLELHARAIEAEKDSSEFLQKWLSAQDLAAQRNVLLIVKQNEIDRLKQENQELRSKLGEQDAKHLPN